MSRTDPERAGFRVLIAGGGVAALEAALALRTLAGDLVGLELLAPGALFFYRPLAVTEPFGGARVRTLELSEVAAAVGADLTLGELVSVEPTRRFARTNHGMVIPYDGLLIACGAVPRPLVRGAVTFRGPAETDRVESIARDAARGAIAGVVFAIPTRRTWLLPMYELAFGLRTVSDVPTAIATVEPAPLADLGAAASDFVRSLLIRDSIDLEPFDAGREWAGSVVVAAPELQARRIYGIPATDDGFIEVDRFAAVRGIPDVWAAGDVTALDVKHGSIATAQADAAAEAIAARAGAEVEVKGFTPVIRAALYCGRETVYARHDLTDLHGRGDVSREPLWSPPAKIYGRYLAPALAGLSLAGAL